MILVLEGLNQTGKTTLAELFSQQLDLPILKFGVPEGEPYPFFRDGLVNAYKASPHFIVDRCHLSNYAYNGCLGGGVMPPDEFWRLDLFLNQMGAWLFLMVDTPSAIEQRLHETLGRMDGADNLTRQQIGGIQNRFLDAFNWSHIETKGSFVLTQFVQDDQLQSQFFDLVEKMRVQIERNDPLEKANHARL